MLRSGWISFAPAFEAFRSASLPHDGIAPGVSYRRPFGQLVELCQARKVRASG